MILRKKIRHDNSQYVQIQKYSENDIFIAGFPKSGNTWMQHLMTGVHFGMTMEYVSNRLVRELTPDVHQVSHYRRFDDICVFKSHHLPQKRMKRVIHLIRDGRDVMVSYHAMHHGMGKKVNLEEMVKQGKHVFPCKWHEHAKAWLENPHNAEIIIVRYEDLQEKPLEELQKVCDFIGWSRRTSFLTEVIQNCSFANMKRKEAHVLWDKNPNWKSGKNFIRKGKIGGYQEEMPSNLIAYFNKEAGPMLRQFGYL